MQPVEKGMDGRAVTSGLFGTLWFRALCILCSIYCFWQLCLDRIRPLRVGIHHPNQARTSPSGEFGSGSTGCSSGAAVERDLPTVARHDGVGLEDVGSWRTEVPLGSGKKLSERDLLRGLLCSLAVYKDKVAAENIFMRAQQDFPSVLDPFLQVHMSDVDEDKTYLVAYAADAIFIAFRGTDSLKDVADDLTVTRSKFGHHEGKFHAGFLKRSEAFQAPNNKLDVLLESEKRIILCGHSLGGAVAHMVLLRYFLDRDIMKSSTDSSASESLFSIAFGAPHVCDGNAARIINENEDFRWRFINFVNQADPVPRFLDNLPRTVITAIKAAPSYLADSDSILAQIGGLAGELLGSYANGQGPNLGSATARVGRMLVGVSWERYKADFSAVRESTTSKPEYHPVGQYVFLTRERPHDPVIGEWGPWRFSIEPAKNRVMSELNIRDYSGRNCDLTSALIHHQLLSYKTALIGTEMLHAPQLFSSKRSTPSQTYGHLISTPSPEIIHVGQVTQEKNRQLHIKGRNLLFLSEPIRVCDESTRWQIVGHVTDTEVVLQRGIIPESPTWFSTEPAMLYITIKTAFGRAEKCIYVKGRVKAEETQYLLKALVQVLLLKASPPMNLLPDSDILNRLDNIVQCATPSQNSDSDRFFSSLVRAMHDRANQETDNVANYMKEANFIIDCVIAFLLAGRVVPIEYSQSSSGTRTISSSAATPTSSPRTWGQYLWKGMKTTGVVCGTAAGVGAGMFVGGVILTNVLVMALPAAEVAIWYAVGMPFYVASPLVAAVASVGAYIELAVPDGNQPSIIPPTPDEYMKWLQRATEEAFQSIDKTRGDHPHPTDLPRDPAAYEKKLVEQVRKASEGFKGMVEHSNCKLSSSCRQHEYHIVDSLSQKFRDSSPHLSPEQLLRRIKIVVQTHDLCDKVLKETFVSVVGAEDAGKSTFIEEVINQFGSPHRPSVMPETGADLHTKDVKSYQVTPNLYLVDFPGGNGIGDHKDLWQQYCLLTGFAILFLHFQGDLKDDQKKMYETMKEGLDKDPIVVFNKVDLYFTPEQDEVFTSEYFESKKKEVARELKCDPKKVYYMSVSPSKFHNAESVQKMAERGVLDLKTFAVKVLNLPDNSSGACTHEVSPEETGGEVQAGDD